MEEFQYILSKQGELAKAYREQEARRKLEKNRAEKARVRELIVKNMIKLSENKD
jgi:hypothetical protein